MATEKKEFEQPKEDKLVKEISIGEKGTSVMQVRNIVTQQDEKKMDVRMGYYKQSGEYMFTGKGFRVNEELAEKIVVAMIEGLSDEAKERIKASL